MVKKSSKNSRIVTIDWTDVGSSVLVGEGNYEVKVIEVEKKTSDNSGEDYLSWQLEIVSEGDFKGKTLYYNTSLQHNSLWSLRNVLEVLGIEIPDGAEDLDLDELVDRTAGVQVAHGEYNKKPKAEIVEFFEFKEEETEEEEDEKPVSKKSKKIVDEDEEEEEAPKKKSSKKSAKKFTEEEILEKDEDELEELNEELKLDVELDDLNTLSRKRGAIIEAIEEKGLLEEAA